VNDDAAVLNSGLNPPPIVATSVRVLSDDPDHLELPLVEADGRAWAVVWPGVGAHLRSMHRLSLGAGGRTHLLGHPMEAVYYVISGAATVEGQGASSPMGLVAGSMVFIHPGSPYRFLGVEEGAELVGGPCPADPGIYTDLAVGPRSLEAGRIDVHHRDTPDLMMPLIARDARLVVWVGRGSQSANMNYVNMEPGERNVPHVHVGSEDTLYVLEGQGTIEDLTHEVELSFEAPCAVHVPVGVWHAVKADRGSLVESVGGPAPADWNMMVRVGAYARLGQ
jgi:quercetin dioxygenase-like cupin family protein